MMRCMTCQKMVLESSEMWGGSLDDLCGCSVKDFKPVRIAPLRTAPAIVAENIEFTDRGLFKLGHRISLGRRIRKILSMGA